MQFYFDILSKNKLIMRVSWDTDTKEVKSEWFDAPHFKIPRTMYPDRITWKNVMNWMETRTVPRTRFGIEELLTEKFGLKEYNAYAMCKKSHAISMSDYLWIRFKDEDIEYDDIKIRD